VALVSKSDYISTYSSEFHGKKYANKYDRWFPVEKNPLLAGLIGDLTTDGHVQGYDKLRFDFTAADKDELRRFEDRLKKLFDVEGKIRENTTNPYSESFNYGVNSKPLTRILIECGVPTGNKVKTRFNVPKWILKERKYFTAYIERAFANDGSAFSENPRITFELRKEESIAENLRKYMETIDEYLDTYYGISGSVFERKEKNQRKDGDQTVGIGLNIRRRDAIKKFHQNFNITDREMSKHIRKVAEDR
jgi:hypothetical protein